VLPRALCAQGSQGRTWDLRSELNTWDQSEAVGACVAVTVPVKRVSFATPITSSPVRGSSVQWSTLGGDSRTFAQVLKSTPSSFISDGWLIEGVLEILGHREAGEGSVGVLSEGGRSHQQFENCQFQGNWNFGRCNIPNFSRMLKVEKNGFQKKFWYVVEDHT